MRFWDTSAVLALVLDDPRRGYVEQLIRSDPGMAVWWGTWIECCSGIARQYRQRLITADARAFALRKLDDLRGRWDEIVPAEKVRDQAHRLVSVHPLRAADALQLGAAKVWSVGERSEFVVFDERLAEAARREGFDVLTTPT